MLGINQATLLGTSGFSTGAAFVPTSFHTDYAKMVINNVTTNRGNYTNSNLTVEQNNVAGWVTYRGVHGVKGGKWRWRIHVDVYTANIMIGICGGITANSNATTAHSPGMFSYAYHSTNGYKYVLGTGSSYGASYGAGSNIDIILDLDNGKIWFAKDGVVQASGNPVAGTNAAATGIDTSLYFYPFVALYNTGYPKVTANFGGSSFGDAGYSGFTNGFPASFIDNGNYPTWDTTRFASTANQFHSLNCSVYNQGSTSTFLGTTFKSSGKLYWCTNINYNVTNARVGIATTNQALNASLGASSYGYGLASTGTCYNNGANVGSGPTYAAGDIIMVAVDLDNLKLWFGKNGVWTGDPAAGTGGITINSGSYTFCSTLYNSSASSNIITGKYGIPYSKPSGFSFITS